MAVDPKLTVRQPLADDAKRCHTIEIAAYSGDEAASQAKILKRIVDYPQGFIILQNQHEIVGFINSGACHQVQLADEDFKDLIGHDPNGAHSVIMSVVVAPAYQGKGYARILLEAFISKMQALNKTHIHLICQTSLLDMYAKFGFVYQCPSTSDHGGLRWHEMVLSLSK
jgi:ribosomal protein S18 acetylase RimI-like enzyme